MKEFHSELSKNYSPEIDMENYKSDKEREIDIEEKQIEIQDNNIVDITIERNFGNTYPLLFYNNEPLIVIGPDWKYFVIIYSIAVIVFALLYAIKIKPKIHLVYQIISAFVFMFFSFSYFMLAFKNQGIPIIPMNKAPDELKNYRQCSICHCLVYLDSEYITYHCSICDICVDNFNHHCPYATKCIANGNNVYFYLFIVSLPILIIGEIAMMLL